jgi:hypothetical protein
MECSLNETKINAYTTSRMILVGKPEGSRTLDRPSCKWVNKIKIVLRRIRYSGVDWIDLPQDRDQWTSEHGNDPLCSINLWEVLSSCTIGGFSRRAQLHDVSWLILFSNTSIVCPSSSRLIPNIKLRFLPDSCWFLA